LNQHLTCLPFNIISAEREGGLHIPISFSLNENRVQETPSANCLEAGVQNFVTHLNKHNIPMAVSKSSSRYKFEKKTNHLQALSSLFEGNIICGDDDQYKMHGKPAPDIVLIAAKVLFGRDVGEPEGEPTGTQLEECSKGL
jgi:pseudouridine-5'-monophosphatase